MAKDTKLSKNTKVLAHLKSLTEQGAIGPDSDWDWESMRRVIWRIVKWNILPELGINPKDPNLKEEFTAAWNTLCAVMDSGYMVESSNFGKQAAIAGFCRKADATEKPSNTAAPE